MRHGQVLDPVQLNAVEPLHYSVQVQDSVQLNAVEPLSFKGEVNIWCGQGRNSVLDFGRKAKDKNLSSSVFNNWRLPDQVVESTQAIQMTSAANQEGWKEGSMVPEKLSRR